MSSPGTHDHHAMMNSISSTATSVGETTTVIDHDHGKMNHGNMGHGNGDHSEMNMDMKMWFHTGVSEVILFENWKISTVGGLVGSMLGIFLMAIFYEGLKYYREYLFRKSYAALNFSCINNGGDGPKMLAHPRDSFRSRMMSLSHLAQTFLHMVQVTLSYFLMLIFMTYNVWLCLAVVLGACVGFFVFGWKKAIVVDVTEHCH